MTADPAGELLADFNAEWERLSDLGVCDDRGGREYLRVLRQWTAADFPYPLEPFIRTYANLPVAGHVPHRKGQRRGIYPRKAW